MGMSRLFKAKLLAIVLGSVIIAGGVTAAFAATPAGQRALHAFTGSKGDATEKPDATEQQKHPTTCAGQPDAERLATQFSLSTASDSDALQAICALHAGTFKGTIPGGGDVSSSHVFGYGEIDLLLTYAQFLAAHDTSNASGKLTTDNARGFLAEAIHNCGTTPLEPCLKAKIPGFQPGNGNGSGGGKPDSTPTPHH